MAESKVLVIDDEKEIGWLFSKILSEEGCNVSTALKGDEGIAKIKKENPVLVILDLKLPHKSGIEVLREIRSFDRELMVVVLTAYETVESAVEAMKLGAHDYLSKPVNIKKIKNLVKNALITKKEAIKTGRERDKKGCTELEEIVGQSHKIQRIFHLINKVAEHDVTVLLKGESGTGKELVAQAIHKKSQRSENPFVVIDCATLPDTLVESEIFGHEKGSFTGAHKRKIGKFEQAHQGTVFLDEIGNLSKPIQVKLLRTLQERKIERVGGKKPIPVDFRLIAATNVDLEKAIEENRFREDLFYRINVFPLPIPSLKDREGDIQKIAPHYLKRFNRILGQNVKSISSEAMDLLIRYSWPGNVRELMHVIESAVLLANDQILPEHLPLKIQEVQKGHMEFEGELKKAGRIAKEQAEKQLIQRVLKEVNWNKSRASQILKIDYKTLFNKIKEYRIREN
ncbi:sigma-54-dependent Fis family transcriptional regulator [bacterium]|nr:sigma-54-dependent Fis family transcriptional regulator [bacterium]